MLSHSPYSIEVIRTSSISYKEQGDRVGDPVELNSRFTHKDLSSGLRVPLIVSQLDLKLPKISQYILIRRIVLKRVHISLTSFIIVSIINFQRYNVTYLLPR